MTESQNKFMPRGPTPVSWGFQAGVIQVSWTREPPFTITGRPGCVHTATITEIAVDREALESAVVNAALVGLVVRAPDGALSRITGMESFCTVIQPRGAALGLLLVPMEEP